MTVARKPLGPALPAGSVRIDARGRVVPVSEIAREVLGKMKGGTPAQHAASIREGKVGEDIVKRLNARCASSGIAFLEKRPAEWRVLERLPDGKTICVPGPKRGVDFDGWLLAGAGEDMGRRVDAEVKRRSKGVLAGADIKPHQRSRLDAVHAGGGVAILLFVVGDRAYAVPWYRVRCMTRITDQDVGAYVVRHGEAYVGTVLQRLRSAVARSGLVNARPGAWAHLTSDGESKSPASPDGAREGGNDGNRA